MDSDDEIEREARTDSESDDDDNQSSLDGSSSDSDTEPVSEDVQPNGHPRVVTPSTSQSPGDAIEVVHGDTKDSFFATSGTWSEMVADETANGPAELPVIDFTQLDSQSFPAAAPPRKPKKSGKKARRPPSPPIPTTSSVAPTAQEEEEEIPEVADSPATASASSRGRFSARRPGQTARQAYQQRLEADPSYVPTVGEFWGHDDRLLDKELRSLSNWWRGRWQGRGRGRGFMRGRGGFAGFARQEDQDGEDTSNLPPVDRAWTHDGFEEMKKVDERRRNLQEQQQQASSPNSFRGGLIGPRGRGGFVGARGTRGGRGAFSPSFRGRGMGHAHNPDRVWFAMKPEFMWTKQHDAFLYAEPHSKSRPAQPTNVRIKLPGGKKEAVVKVTLNTTIPVSDSKSAPQGGEPVASTSTAGSDVGERVMVVRLPKREATAKVAEEQAAKPAEPSIDEVFTVRPCPVSPKPIPLPDPASVSSRPSQPVVSIEPHESDPVRIEEAVLRHPPSSSEEPQQQLPQLHHPVPETRPMLLPLQTNFGQPPSQGSPGYPSPYAYPAPLPPGIALNSVGMPYEIATGRPIYLPPPNIPSMYTPPPMMQPHPPHFVPGHMHHHSAMSSSEFLPPGTPPSGYMEYTHTPNRMGPSLFSYPRQSSRIEIRAPEEPSEKTSSGSPSGAASEKSRSNSNPPRPTHLRHNAAVFEPSKLGSSASSADEADHSSQAHQEYFPQYDMNMGYDQGGYSHEYSGAVQGEMPGGEQEMMGYQAYPGPQYYYTEAAYGYNPYLDMSQAGQYDGYTPDQVPHGTVYYH
ncbi:hypothetical protein K435DRAFT_4592 [Dendrothele bispora CBS 962.96]|uniref:Btz domain-containing protein n=1 Tax=Dendrothele bispora (strain CBS 962.96) TaxID=1314807 RepID=A0A4S8MYP3_DENBC|nr:hypothetical protein K435DRAFT_4592 [Dendrothele bispora CBS 962.96]